MNKQDIIKSIEILNNLIQETESGNRDGWGYDLNSFKVTIQCLYNEQKMKGCEKDVNARCL